MQRSKFASADGKYRGFCRSISTFFNIYLCKKTNKSKTKKETKKTNPSLFIQAAKVQQLE